MRSNARSKSTFIVTIQILRINFQESPLKLAQMIPVGYRVEDFIDYSLYARNDCFRLVEVGM